jgi:hypothetical protein
MNQTTKKENDENISINIINRCINIKNELYMMQFQQKQMEQMLYNVESYKPKKKPSKHACGTGMKAACMLKQQKQCIDTVYYYR